MLPGLSGAPRQAAGRPVILFTPDWAETSASGAPEGYQLTARCVDAVTGAGGFALILPPGESDIVEAATAVADGIVVTGSDPGAEVSGPRLAFERALVAAALRRRVPVLGICHGMQVIGEVLGGEIRRDLPDLLAADSPHLPHAVPDRLAHEVALAPGSRLASWHGGPVARVNSLHRHALGTAGRARIVAVATDGLIEAIEGPGPGFCLGVQWHPEYGLTPLDRAIWRGFVAACAEPADFLEGVR